jgi:hypothetical protein
MLSVKSREAAGVLAVEVYRRAASSFAVGLMAAEEDGFPLNQRQIASVVACLIQGFDGLVDALAFQLEADEEIRRVVNGGGGWTDHQRLHEPAA